MQNVENELNYLKVNWKSIMNDMAYKDSRSQAVSILRSAGAQLVKLEDNILTIGFRNQVFIDKLNLPENGLIVKTVIEKALGHAIGITFILGDFRTPGEIQEEEQLKIAYEKKQEEEWAAEHDRAVSEERTLMRERWNGVCGIPLKFSTATFESYKDNLQKKAFQLIYKYAQEYYSLDVKRSMVMYSEGYGVGKTHLSSAIGHYLIDNYPDDPLYKPPCPVLFTQETELLLRIRATYNRNYDDKGETEIQVFNKLRNVGLLIIDDVGKQQPADPKFCQRVYFDVINSRYNSMKPIILTSNLDTAKLASHIGDASADRLAEMCGEYIIELTGKSYRTRK